MSAPSVLITGGAKGIGFAIAERLVKRGARVILWDIDAAALRSATDRLGPLASGRVLIALRRLRDCSRGSVYPLNLQLRRLGHNAGRSLAAGPFTGGLPKWS